MRREIVLAIFAEAISIWKHKWSKKNKDYNKETLHMYIKLQIHSILGRVSPKEHSAIVHLKVLIYLYLHNVHSNNDYMPSINQYKLWTPAVP